MNDKDKSFARKFFTYAYTAEWQPADISEDKMLHGALSYFSEDQQSQLRQVFQAILRQSDDVLFQTLVYELGCQTQPLGAALPNKNARQLLNYVCDFIFTQDSNVDAQLIIQGNTLRDSDGTLIATLNAELGGKSAMYARRFALSGELAHYVTERVEAAMSEYARAYDDAERFNTNVNQPGRGNAYTWKDRTYPDLPDWLQTGVTLMTKLEGSDEGNV